MKTQLIRTSFVCVLLFCLMSCSDESETDETPQGLGKAIFDALQDNDQAAFDSHFYSQNDQDQFLKQIKGDERLTETNKTQTQALIINFLQPVQQAETGFAGIRQRALECGLQNWSDAEFVTSTFDEQNRDYLRLASVKALFRWKGLEYEIRLDRCLKTERGWVLLEAPEIRCNQN